MSDPGDPEVTFPVYATDPKAVFAVVRKAGPSNNNTIRLKAVRAPTLPRDVKVRAEFPFHRVRFKLMGALPWKHRRGPQGGHSAYHHVYFKGGKWVCEVPDYSQRTPSGTYKRVTRICATEEAAAREVQVLREQLNARCEGAPDLRGRRHNVGPMRPLRSPQLTRSGSGEWADLMDNLFSST